MVHDNGNTDTVDRVSAYHDALQYILEAKNTEGDCYEFVARLKARAFDTLRDWQKDPVT